jgi:hypothetical protein
MGFSAEATILMADGRYKSIANIKAGEYVMNRRKKPVRVMANYKQLAEDTVSFERNGDNTTMYCTPDQKFNAIYTNTSGSTVNGMLTITEMNTYSASFKNSTKMFSTTSNVVINNYSGTLVSKDVWSLDVSDSSKSFVVNTIFTIEDSRV